MTLSVFCDGGARGNPGPAAVGFVVFKNGRQAKRFSKRIGKTTNNVAEYKAVVAALKWIIENKEILISSVGRLPPINFYLDSELVTKQLRGVYKVKSPKLQELVIQTKNLEREIGMKIFYHLVSRRKNKIADSLVNQALNQKAEKADY